MRRQRAYEYSDKALTLSKRFGACGLCHREMDLTFHHYIPKTLHTNRWFRKNHSRIELNFGIDLCRDCHSAVHRFVPSEKELGRDFNTYEKLMAHSEICGFVEWISQRPQVGKVRTRTPRVVNSSKKNL